MSPRLSYNAIANATAFLVIAIVGFFLSPYLVAHLGATRYGVWSLITGLVGYLDPHAEHTPYRRRLAEGRSIGSGMVEGTCKTAIGQRLKQTGARWKVRRLERMAALCCLVYSEQFEAYWKKAAG